MWHYNPPRPRPRPKPTQTHPKDCFHYIAATAYTDSDTALCCGASSSPRLPLFNSLDSLWMDTNTDLGVRWLTCGCRHSYQRTGIDLAVLNLLSKCVCVCVCLTVFKVRGVCVRTSHALYCLLLSYDLCGEICGESSRKKQSQPMETRGNSK
ncbi:hypothetical protein INR49_002132 [Caranx melampygus]|nr:hypothetical protein INR49_002132 [Caranx melampygus]